LRTSSDAAASPAVRGRGDAAAGAAARGRGDAAAGAAARGRGDAAAGGGPAPAEDLAPRLRLSLTRTARRLRQESGSLLSPSLTAALATVERHGPMTPSDLAARERVQRPTATRLLARLEDEGLVSRTPDPTDGRCSLVSLTPEGRALLEGLRTRKTAYLARRLEGLRAEDRAVLARAADLLEAMLEADVPDAGRAARGGPAS
jgi:DNA-binding MarR family transcriptional regulator